MGAFRLSGNVAGEKASEMFIIFSASREAETVKLPEGKWQVCVNHEKAGTECLAVVEKQVTLSPISAMVLVKESHK